MGGMESFGVKMKIYTFRKRLLQLKISYWCTMTHLFQTNFRIRLHHGILLLCLLQNTYNISKDVQNGLPKHGTTQIGRFGPIPGRLYIFFVILYS